MRLCLARVVTPRLTRAMGCPPYFRPYGAQAFTRAVSASASTSVPRFWRMYLALWLIRRWRLPATPCLILPVAVSLKRFLTPLFVLSLGIFVSFDVWEPPRQPLPAGRFVNLQNAGRPSPLSRSVTKSKCLACCKPLRVAAPWWEASRVGTGQHVPDVRRGGRGSRALLRRPVLRRQAGQGRALPRR